MTYISGHEDPDGDGWHFIINTDFLHAGQKPLWQGLPHLSFGAKRGRANGNQPPAMLNGPDDPIFGDHQYLTFDAQQWRSDSGQDGGSYRVSGLYLLAEWGEAAPGVPHPRGFFVFLHEDANDHPGVESTVLPDGWASLRWNWPIEQSTYFPGADWIFTTLGHLNAVCPEAILGSSASLTPVEAVGNLTRYKFHLTKMFQCAENLYSPWTETLPASRVPVTGIYWFQEGAQADPEQASPSIAMWMQVANARVSKF